MTAFMTFLWLLDVSSRAFCNSVKGYRSVIRSVWSNIFLFINLTASDKSFPKSLERKGVIQNYILVLNNTMIGQLHYKVLIGLRNLTEKRYAALIEFCKLHPNIIYLVKTFGVWEFEIDMEVRNSTQFRSIMRKLKKEFSDIISDYNAINIYQIHKYNFCPLPKPRKK